MTSPATELTGELISFASEDRTLEGYLVRPVARPDRSDSAPGMLVIHEIFGLTDEIRAVAERMAQAGYVALAVDLFANQNKAVCMAQMLGGVFADSLGHQGIRDTRAALGELAALSGVDASRLGAIGFCLGGSLAIALACTDQRVRAVAPYYGFNPRPLEAVRRACPVVGSYPEKDITAGQGRALAAELEAAGVANDIKVYPGARHSFATPGPSFDGVASIDAWNRVMGFFDEHLVGG
ncbi:dienelactone hydrolase family protein [Deinococcus psychrotolerans]|uniref:Dienelactone hydrolase family protein n=1 Tax=Deinococcus psychrotolerans TaxID=2489213 RepID=A0A3G8YGM3_9DEIO|nr:dienelactone hydrolase family protein [Deinococcus psychrotolerans]AZI43337.1 dienelactone hydrolase family protein [Deinococcus psychrotolerans]